MPRSKKQNEEMRTAARTAVLNSAMTLFAQNGYAHTTTRSIAQEAGISIGLMYHYFDSKESLLRAVFDHSMSILSETFAQSYEQSKPSERLANLLRSMLMLLTKDESFWALFYMLRTQPAIQRELGDDFRIWTERLRDLFEAELVQFGHENPHIEAYMLYSLIEGTIQQYLLDPQTYPLVEMIELIIHRYAKPLAN